MKNRDEYCDVRLREYGSFANFAVRQQEHWLFIGYLRVARRFFPRLFGWRQRHRGRAGERCSGIWLPNCRVVHSFFLHESLQLVWLNDAGQVIREQVLRPYRIAWCKEATGVIELAADTLALKRQPHSIHTHPAEDIQ